MSHTHKTSVQWVSHFEENAKALRINWNLEPNIDPKIKAQILPSLKAWQKGETSDGKNLIYASTKYAIQTKDLPYLDAIKLFIKEEQKHGENLGKYIDAIGEKRIQFNLGDYLFRRVRYFAKSIEVWTITVIIVESYAQIFYKALHDASECKLLRQICSDILKDEAHHIRFQYERLNQIIHHRENAFLGIRKFLYKMQFKIITWAIWRSHKNAFIAGGVDKTRFISKANKKFKGIMNKVFKPELTYKMVPVNEIGQTIINKTT
jgi:hypothetical protein